MPTSGTKSKFQPMGTATRSIMVRLSEDDSWLLAKQAAERNMTMTDFIRYAIRRLHNESKEGKDAVAGVEAKMGVVVTADESVSNLDDPELYRGLGEKTYTMAEIEALRKQNSDDE